MRLLEKVNLIQLPSNQERETGEWRTEVEEMDRSKRKWKRLVKD